MVDSNYIRSIISLNHNVLMFNVCHTSSSYINDGDLFFRFEIMQNPKLCNIDPLTLTPFSSLKFAMSIQGVQST